MRISDWSSDVGSSDLSGGSWGANSSTAGLYAACEQLRAQIAQKAGFNIADVEFADGQVRSGNRTAALRDVAAPDGLTVEGGIEFGDLDKKFAQASFGAHFCEVGVDRSEEHTSELQSLMRISYAVFCLKKKKNQYAYRHHQHHD